MDQRGSDHTFGILVGGGPAPGINGVIGAAATTALRSGARVIGILDGFRWLMEGDTSALKDHTRSLSLDEVARIHVEGGSILHTSRANPTRKQETLENCVASLDALGIDRLVTIGGDDTAFSAKRVSDTAAGRIGVVHVPKTIDNDLPLPEGVPTFGYESAREHATSVVQTILEDCRTTNRWFIIVMMGRKAGHLALGAGVAAGAPITLIGEEFSEGPIRLSDVVRTLESAIVRRLVDGHPDGVAVVAEGIAERLDPNELEALKDVGRDEHGHIRLADVPLGKVLADAVQGALAERGISVAIGTKDVGYELRCVSPSAYDREYTRALGVGAVEALLSGKSRALITRTAGRTGTLPFDELMDPETGRTRVRMVELDSDTWRHARALQTRIEPGDLADPERLERIASAARLSPDEARKRYAPLS